MLHTNRKILCFKIGEESIPVITTDEEQDNSPFGSTIKRAISYVEDKIIARNSALNPNNISLEHHETNLNNEISGIDWESNTRNNIVTFLGDRGSGKTSCMRSVVNSCRNTHKDWIYTKEIDPSFFDESHNILEILIGELYGMFRGYTEKWEQLKREQQEALRCIEKNFRKVKEALKYFESKSIINEDLSDTEGLRLLNNGGQLRRLMMDLISNILKYKSGKYLIISIDDLDLNISNSYVMMEHIRKFLILPNVVILVAARYQQLFDSICLELTKHYKDLRNRISDEDISEMAERYLNKTLPLDLRIEMPSAESLLQAELKLLDKDGNPCDSGESETVADKIPALIFKKTRYLFYNSSGIPSLIIPRNLRDTRMLIGMLYGMNDFSDDTEDNSGRQNQIQFKTYFIQEWMGKIDVNYRSFAKTLLEEENPAKINKQVIMAIYEFFIKDMITFKDLDSELKEYVNQESSYYRERSMLRDILNPENSYWNVSVGDVVYIINYVRKHFDSDKTTPLLFFIETFYSFRLYELYNEMTDSISDNALPSERETLLKSPELKASIHGELPPYFRFVGGTFFATTGDYFISVAANDKDLRESRIVNGQVLMKEIKNVVTYYKKLSESQKKPSSGLSAKLRLCEFFMLTIRGRVDLKASDINIRLLNEPQYFSIFGDSIKNLRFEVTAPFFNAIYPKFCYDRFNKDIFEFAQKDEESLLNRMIRHDSRNKINSTWELMSKASIRNMEVLEDLTSWMRSKKPALRPKSKDSNRILLNFYKLFEISQTGNIDEVPSTGYCVKTYDREWNQENNQRPFYLINYSIFSLLKDILSEIYDLNAPGFDTKNADMLRKMANNIMAVDVILPDEDYYDKENTISILSQYCGHSKVISSFKTNNKELLNSDEVARILAELRIEYGVDFSKILPPMLQSKYQEISKDEFLHRKNNLEEEENRIEDAIQRDEAKKKRFEAKIKELTKLHSEYLKSANNELIEKNKQNGNILKNQENIKFLQSQKESEEDKAKRNRIDKELDKTHKELNNSLGRIKESENNSISYQTMAIEISNNLDKITEETDNLDSEIRNNQRKKQSVAKDIKTLDDHYSNPTTFDKIL